MLHWKPIRISQVLKEKLTDTSELQDLSRTARVMWQVRGYLLAYLPIEMAAIMALGLVSEGNIAGGLLIGGRLWMAQGAVLKLMQIRDNPKS